MKVLQKVEIVIFMPILFARSMLSFAQYKMKKIRGYAFPWVSFNALCIVRTATSSSAFYPICFLNLLRKIKILRQVEIVVIFMPFFGKYEMKSSEIRLSVGQF